MVAWERSHGFLHHPDDLEYWMRRRIGILAAALGGLTTAVGVVGVVAALVAIATFVATRRPDAVASTSEDVRARETA